MERALDVYFHRDLAGQVWQGQAGEMRFQYGESWLGNPAAVPLSQSLPLRKPRFGRKECAGYFGGILPEDTKRQVIARNLGISARNDFALLERIGGECAGAVTFVPHGQVLPDRSDSYRPVPNAKLAAILAELPQRPLLAGEAGIRLSLAGAQDKIAVRVDGRRVLLPLDGAVSTHILKPAMERFDGVAFVEAYCMRLAALAGLPTAPVESRRVEGVDYLQVERYDRVREPELVRLHQEDFCQALGIVSERKYQKEGGPSLKQCFRLLRDVSSAPVIDLRQLLEAVIFNYLVGNNDAHGKNFSLLYRVGTRLAPLYDVVCTAVYPDLSRDMAMRIGGEYQAEKVTPEDFAQLAGEAGLSKSLVRMRVAEVADAVLGAQRQLKSGHRAAEKVARLVSERCEKARAVFRGSKRG